jgi:hypothetical protein
MENALDWLALLCISLVFVRIVTFNRQGPGEGMYIARRSFPHTTTKRGSRKLTFLQFDSAHVFQAPIVTSIELRDVLSIAATTIIRTVLHG